MFNLFSKKPEKDIYLYNTLSRKKEVFKPIKSGKVGMYTCGPTVYNYPHLGNMRTYIFEDLLKRVLQYNGYKVNHVMNITDVGHLTNDRDMGEDKIEKEAKKEGKTAWDIALFYTKAFFEDEKYLNIIKPTVVCKATDNIKEQIELIQRLEKKGFTYKTSDGIYFDTSKFPDYAKLSGQKLEDLKEGARVEANTEKKNHTDFALWKFSPKDSKREMEWPSPWGVGFPGWHIECSAMSMKYLGEHFDIHCGGIDHVNIHHTNEIAQSEAATGKKSWVNYWVHGAFLNIQDGEKMSKSSGHFVTVENTFIEKNINPLVYRFADLSVHYRKQMEWNDDIVTSAKNGLENLYAKIVNLGDKKGKVNKEWKEKFLSAINDDLNLSQGLAVLNEMLKSEISSADKLATVIDFDEVLGLGFNNLIKKAENIPDEVKKLVSERENARKNKDWKKSDELRDEIKKLGYEVKDTLEGQSITKI
jgi:cysteinyl-tRNA synthetase